MIRYSVSFTKDIEELLSELGNGLEGLIGRRSGSRYEAGKRSGAWIKLKLHQEQEFVIGEYTEPDGVSEAFWCAAGGRQRREETKIRWQSWNWL